MIKDDTFSVGDRLPGERRLAEMFETSRNTIREVLCNLETMGYVEIRGKSGCYLRRKEGRIGWESLRNRSSRGAVRQILETLSLVTPRLASSQATRLGREDIVALESATARLGKAIVNFNVCAVAREYISFFLALAESSGNDYLILLMKELLAAAKNLKHCGTGLSEVQMDSMFAYHVELFNALKTRRADDAQMLAEQCVQTFYRLILPEA